MATATQMDAAEGRVHQQSNVRVTALPDDHGWKNEEGPVFFKFEKPGDMLCGTLMDVREITMSGKLVKQYTVDLGNGLAKFNGTYSIQEKLGAHHIGKLVRVRYLGDDVALGAPQNPLKIFQVQTKEVRRNSNSLEISDDDLPAELRA